MNRNLYKIGGELLRKAVANKIGDKNSSPIRTAIALGIPVFDIYESANQCNLTSTCFRRLVKKSGQYSKIAGMVFLTKNDIQDAKLLYQDLGRPLKVVK